MSLLKFEWDYKNSPKLDALNLDYSLLIEVSFIATSEDYAENEGFIIYGNNKQPLDPSLLSPEDLSDLEREVEDRIQAEAHEAYWDDRRSMAEWAMDAYRDRIFDN